MSIENLTNPGVDPVEGDIVKVTVKDATVTHQYHEPVVPDLEHQARLARDGALAATDATPADHSKLSEIMAYRQELRDWPHKAGGGWPDISKMPQHP